jgi:16S rRNA (guanine966-N2)-methyltransferase
VRIIAGSRKGHRISAPRGTVTRPTGDRVREAAFNLLGPIEGASALDLFAGSGAMGLEALSRGARRCVFVESDRAACKVVQQNVERLRLTGVLVLQRDALSFLREERAAGRRYDLVLADPPYGEYPALQMALSELLPAVLEPDGVLLLETAAREQPELPLSPVTSRKYGSARLTLYRSRADT